MKVFTIEQKLFFSQFIVSVWMAVVASNAGENK